MPHSLMKLNFLIVNLISDGESVVINFILFILTYMTNEVHCVYKVFSK